MLVTIYTPKTKLFSDLSAVSVYLPGTKGDMQILNNHIPVITTLKEGNIVVLLENKEKISVAVDRGYVQFAENQMTILIEKTTISNREIKEIEKKARAMKGEEIRDDIDITEDEFEHMEDNKHHV